MWEIIVKYKDREHHLFAEVEYDGPKRMHIRITGTKKDLLLQNDWPIVKHSENKNAIHWQVIEGKKVFSTPSEGKFMQDIYQALEEKLKGK